ncbi:MAG: hypothetical protein ABSG53_30710 [Thermoguttaceae bacterium]
MKRLPFITAMLLGVSASLAWALETAGPKPKAISLEIPDTGQEQRRPESGWCGEAAIQMAVSYYGAYASQQAINRAGKPEHPDLYAQDIPRAMRNLGLEFSPWSGNGLEAFLKWVRSQLAEGHPVLLGVKIYPTAHWVWPLDHFVLAVGCTEEALTLDTTWGRQETKTFARLSTREKGLSFANPYGVYFGYAITGMKMDSTQAGLRPTRVTIERDGDKQVKLRVSMKSLESGKRYRLVKFTDLAAAQKAMVKGDVVLSFVADGPNAVYRETIRIDDARVYRCGPSP